MRHTCSGGIGLLKVLPWQCSCKGGAPLAERNKRIMRPCPCTGLHPSRATLPRSGSWTGAGAVDLRLAGGSDLGAGTGAGRGRRPWGRAHACRRQRPRGGTNALRAEQARAWDGELGAEHARAGGSHVGAEQSGAGSAPRWGGAGRGQWRAMLGRSRQGPVARHFGAEQAGASGEGKRRWPNQEEDNRGSLLISLLGCKYLCLRRVVEVTHAGGRTLSSHGLLQRDMPLCGWHPRRTSRGTLQHTPWLNTKAPRDSCYIMAK